MYGAVGTATGFSKETLLRAAGVAQSRAGTSNRLFGSWWSGASYGDDRGQ
ncbi:polymorphic toxin type 44 domain-containing protein [Pseudomonas taetrolens]|nr:polymorphic toxin type 44 domain-containing protein [Pseudomonas taetrolens]